MVQRFIHSLSQPASIPFRQRVVILILLTALCVLLFLTLKGPFLGITSLIFSILPVATAGWFFGTKAGIFISLAAIPFKLFLLYWKDGLLWTDPRLGDIGAIAIVLFLTGLTFGLFRRLWLKYDRELSEHRAVERQLTQANASLGEREAQYRSLFENHHTIMLMIDPLTTQIIDANPAACQFYGYSREELRQMKIGQINQLPSESLQDALAHAVQDITPHFVFKHRLANGDIREVEVDAISVQVSGRNLLYSIIHDISERLETENKLRQAQTNLRNVIRKNVDGIIITDLEGYILFVNPAAEALWGKSSHELEGELFGHPPTSGQATEIEIFHAGDKLRSKAISAEIRAAEIEWEGRNAILISLRDITHRKRIEQAEREQRVLAEALRDSAAALTRTLHLDDVLECILKNIGRVVPHQGANILLVNSDQTITRVARSEGYDPKYKAGEDSVLGRAVQNLASLSWMVQTGQPLIIPDTEQYPAWVTLPEVLWVRSYIGAPLIVKDKILGFLNLDSAVPGFFGTVHAERLAAFVDQAAVAIDNARLYTALQQQAVTDEGTRLYNRHGLFELGLREFDRSLRFHRPLSAVMLDIDHFKQVNDSFGHPVGDQVLRILADRCRQSVREVDIVGRYGGEEFLILLVENDLETAAAVAERLRQVVEAHPISTKAGMISITISLGVASLTLDIPDLEALIQQADRALYQAKADGRNRFVLAR